MSTITKEQAKDLRNAFQCWQQDYDPVEDKEQYDMFGLGVVAMDALLASLEAEESGRNPVLAYADSYRDMAKQGVESIPVWSVITDLERNIAPLYTAPPAPAKAEPVAWLWSHRKHPSEVTLVRPEDDEKAEPGLWSGWSCQALYADPLAPVSVPDDVSGPLAHAYKELTPTFMRNHIDVFERYGIYPDGSAGIQAMRIALDGMNRRAAMLQGAEPDFREISNSSTKHFRENAETSTKCWCHACRPVTFSDSRLVVCPECGNKRCPHANDHRNACTESNEPGQEGSAYPAAPQQEVAQALAKGMERYGDAMNELAKREVKP